MLGVYRVVEAATDAILKKNGTSNLFSPSVFREICWLCSTLSQRLPEAPEL
jgi:hypothetical protein